MSKIKYINPEDLSGFFPPQLNKSANTIKKGNFIVTDDISVGGDAPKDFIKVFSYGKVRKKNTKKWTKYIAKTGHKRYPSESITEHLLNCVGSELGLYMSNSKLAMISGQLRFLSEYFLDHQEQILVHGVDIFAGYISDRDFVEQIEEQQLAREFFTFQFAIKAIEFAFPKNSNMLIENFVKLIVFDGIVGNNDRHFYNWGIVKSVSDKHEPYFSPIYDTARGLFWNDSEQKIVDIVSRKNQVSIYLNKYTKNSYPKTGWEGDNNLNHIELISKIKAHNTAFETIITEMTTNENEEKILRMLKINFSSLLSVERMFIIVECLKLRFQQIRAIL